MSMLPMLAMCADKFRPHLTAGWPGLLGREKSSMMPRMKAQRSSSLLMNSGPLSRRIVLGHLTSCATRSSVFTASDPLQVKRASITGESRVNVSTTVSTWILFPSKSSSRTKSIAQTWSGPYAGERSALSLALTCRLGNLFRNPRPNSQQS